MLQSYGSNLCSSRIPEFYTSQKIEKVFKFAMQLLDSDLFVVMRQLEDKKLVIHPDDLKSMTYQLVDAVKCTSLRPTVRVFLLTVSHLSYARQRVRSL